MDKKEEDLNKFTFTSDEDGMEDFIDQTNETLKIDDLEES